MIDLCCEYLSAQWIRLYVIIMSHTSFRVNLHIIVCLNVKELESRMSRVRILSLSLKLHIWHLLRVRSSLTFRQTIECRFTLKLVRDMIITNSPLLMTFIDFNFEELKICPGIYVFMCIK